ncbi:YciI family protein [Yunchengibacter salinarum]|uniref:YciI family protein n=1 Tax=Yunchengibacter salinarum TaxID=3133399 RepID=UPI0035B5C945
MLFMILCHDGPDGADLRQTHRPAHLDYIKSAGDRVKVAGPILSDDAEPHPVGSMILIDAGSLTAAHLFAENDPYRTAGVFERVEVWPWKPVIGGWLNG